MAHIEKMNNGRYRVFISYKTPNGDYKRFTKAGFLTKTDANNYAINKEAEKINDRLEGTVQQDELLSKYFKDWYLVYKTNRSNRTLRQYENTLMVINKYIPNATVKTLTRREFQQFVNEYGTTHARQTVNKHIGHIKTMYLEAVEQFNLKTNPTKNINIVANGKIQNKDDKFLEFDDYKKLLDYVSDNLDLNSFMIYTGLLSGARYGELAALDDSDIDKKNKVIHITKSTDINNEVKTPKTKNSIRDVSMPDKWFVQYDKYTHKSDRLFDITSNGINKALRLLCNQLDIKSVTFHALRHTHASILLSNDISLQYVSERLGHANLSITQEVYAHFLDKKRTVENSKTMDLLDQM